MKVKIKNIILGMIYVIVTIIWTWIMHRYMDASIFEAFIISGIGFTPATLLIVLAIILIIWRIQNGVNIFATLETDPEILKLKILYKMRGCNPFEFTKVANEIIRESHNYPQWDILGSRMYQSWYKYNIDYMLQRPSIFDMSTFYGGHPYIKENDTDYNINADPWEETDWNSIELEEI